MYVLSAFDSHSSYLFDASFLVKIIFVVEIFDIPSAAGITCISPDLAWFARVGQLLPSILFLFSCFSLLLSILLINLSKGLSSFEYQVLSLFVLNVFDLFLYFVDFIFDFGERVLDKVSVFLEFLLFLVEGTCFVLDFFSLF